MSSLLMLVSTSTLFAAQAHVNSSPFRLGDERNFLNKS